MKYLPFNVRSVVKTLLNQPTFTLGAWRRKVELYHEPNFIPLRFNGPTVLTVHDLSYLRYPEAHPAERVRHLERRLPAAMAQAGAILTDSRFVKTELTETFAIPPEKIHPTLLGVSGAYHPRSEAEVVGCLAQYDLTYDGYVLAVGTLEPRKNLPRAIRAYAALPAALRERYPLVLAGMSGWEIGDLMREIRPLVSSGQIRRLGYVPNDLLPQLYSAAALFIYPSLYEGFGLPPLEAMASGVPVIASNAASLPEVVGDAGVQVDPQDEEAMRDAMRRLLEDRGEAARLGRLGEARARQFSWEECARLTAAAYRLAARQA